MSYLSKLKANFPSVRKLLGRRGKQVGVFYCSLIFSLLFSIGNSVLNTRMLGPDQFGDFKFLQAVWSTSILFFTWGYFVTGGNLLAKKNDPNEEKPLYGSLLIVAAITAMIFIVIIFLASFPFERIYSIELGQKVRIFSVLLFVFPLRVCLQNAFRGMNSIYSLALLNVMPQMLYFIAAYFAATIFGLSLNIALFLYLFCLGISIGVTIFLTKPQFINLRGNILNIIKNNKAIGFPIYIALLVGTASEKISYFTLAYLFDTKLVGFFALAITITMPLTMIPNAIATTFFKQFATADKIEPKILLTSFGLSASTLVVYILLIKKMIILLYGHEYIEIIPLVYVCSVASIMHGLGDLYNRYLLSHGETICLRTNAIQLGAVNVIGYPTLIYLFNINGAVITKLIVDSLYLITMLVYYKKLVE